MAGSLDNLWQKVLEQLQAEVQKPTYETWFKPTRALRLEENTFVIKVPHAIAKEWLESRYRHLIQKSLESVTGEAFSLQFEISEDISTQRRELEVPKIESLPQSTSPPNRRRQILLNPKYTFDTFVVGKSNQFAHAAALAVAESPARAYNPLFLYGGVGLGKTHLMQAIGHFVMERDSSAKVVYVSSENFTNEIIEAIRSKETRGFKSKYRDVDLLLIDDIQFIAGKESTQVEFFHTFNSLYEAGRQIVISSDRPPRNIPTLEDRLRSRFEWGLTTDIQVPELETRIAILKRKADDENLSVPNDVIFFIANQINSNIRELEGALIRVIAHSSLLNSDITVDVARKVLKDIISPDSHKSISVDLIQQVVSEHFRVATEDLKSKKRVKTITIPRQVAMYLARKLTDLSLIRIGDEFGGRDHTTVIHACEKVNRDSQKDPEIAQSIKTIIDRLQRPI